MTTEATTPLPDVLVRNVVVPLDGSELSLQAMPTARSLARRFRAELHTVTVAVGDHEVDRDWAPQAPTSSTLPSLLAS